VLPGATSRAGDRGGTVRAAGTEKTKLRSRVHAGENTHTHTHDNETQGDQ